jgi:two-component system alkaline phosphatase synthesis response regulator PhoP
MKTSTNRILILSESQKLIKSILTDLDILGYTAFSGDPAELETESILRQSPDVILFDLSNWNETGIQLYQGLRSNTRLENQGVGNIVLVSEGSLPRLPPAFEFDDLVLVPYKIQELDFRIKRLLWQKDKVVSQEIIKIEDLVIYLARYEVRIRGKDVELTFKEYELLKYLASHRGRAFNRESLLNIVWGYGYYGGTRTVDVHIRRIRAKIGDEEGHYIKTVRNVGYMFRE